MRKFLIAAAAALMIAAMPTAAFAHGGCHGGGHGRYRYNNTTAAATCVLNSDGTYTHTSACDHYNDGCTLEGCTIAHTHTHTSCTATNGCGNYYSQHGTHAGHGCGYYR